MWSIWSVPTKAWLEAGKFRLGALLMGFLFLTACQEQILHNLSEGEANKVRAGLDEVSIGAEKVKQPDGKWGLMVKKSHALQAIKYLNESRLLPETSAVMPEKSSMIASREEQRFRYERAISREIEATLTNMPGVLESRVHLNLPVLDPLFGQPLDDRRGSASVLLVVKGSTLDKEQVQMLVAGASGVPGSAITVVLSEAAQRGAEAASIAPGAAPKADKALSAAGSVLALAKQPLILVVLALSLLGLGSLSLVFGCRRQFGFRRRMEAYGDESATRS